MEPEPMLMGSQAHGFPMGQSLYPWLSRAEAETGSSTTHVPGHSATQIWSSCPSVMPAGKGLCCYAPPALATVLALAEMCPNTSMDWWERGGMG